MPFRPMARTLCKRLIIPQYEVKDIDSLMTILNAYDSDGFFVSITTAREVVVWCKNAQALAWLLQQTIHWGMQTHADMIEFKVSDVLRHMFAGL